MCTIEVTSYYNDSGVGEIDYNIHVIHTATARKYSCKKKINIWFVWGFNSWPWHYQHHALPTELTDQLNFAGICTWFNVKN